MVLVKPELKPRRLEADLRTACASQRKGAAPEAERGTFVHRCGGGRSSHPPHPPKAPAVQQPPAREMNRRPRGAGVRGDRPASSSEPSGLLQRGCGVSRWKGRWPGMASSAWSRLPGGRESSLGGDVAVGGEQTPPRQVPGVDPGQHPSAPLPAASPRTSNQGLQAASPVPLVPLLQAALSRTQRGSKEKIIQRLKNPPGFNSKVRATTYNSSFSYAAGAVVSRCKAAVCWELFLPASKNVLLLNHSVANIIYYIIQYISVFTGFIKRISKKKRQPGGLFFCLVGCEIFDPGSLTAKS